jgi:hypothetical protein
MVNQENQVSAKHHENDKITELFVRISSFSFHFLHEQGSSLLPEHRTS